MYVYVIVVIISSRYTDYSKLSKESNNNIVCITIRMLLSIESETKKCYWHHKKRANLIIKLYDEIY